MDLFCTSKGPKVKFFCIAQHHRIQIWYCQFAPGSLFKQGSKPYFDTILTITFLYSLVLLYQRSLHFHQHSSHGYQATSNSTTSISTEETRWHSPFFITTTFVDSLLVIGKVTLGSTSNVAASLGSSLPFQWYRHLYRLHRHHFQPHWLFTQCHHHHHLCLLYHCHRPRTSQLQFLLL